MHCLAYRNPISIKGPKPLWNARGHQVLRWYCLKNCHTPMMDIATLAREYFGKSLSLNTVCRCIKKCNLKLHYAKRQAFINFGQKRHRVLWAWSHLRPKDSGNMFSGQTTCFWENCDAMGVYQCPQHGWYAYTEGTIDAEAYVGIWRDICCSQDDDFSEELLQQNNARPARVTTAWLRRHRVRVLDWPACSPDLSPIENVWRIMKRRIRQQGPRTVEQLKSYIHHEWPKSPLAKLQ